MLSANVRRALSGSPQIEELQQALKNLAQAMANSAFDSGSVMGIITDRTLGALKHSIMHLVAVAPGLRQMSGILISTVQNAVADSNSRPFAADLINRYAQQLTMAARVLAYRFAANQHPVAPSAPPVDPGLSGIMDIISASKTAAQKATASVSKTASTRRAYPEGSIKTDGGKVWRIAIPKAAVKAALGGVDPGLGGDFVEQPSISKDQVPVSQETNVPIKEVSQENFEKKTKPWYKKWQTWAIVGGVIVVGGTIVVLTR